MGPVSRFLLLLPFTLSLILQPHQVFAIRRTHIGLVTKTCEHAVYYKLCISSLTSDPNSQKTDLKGLATIAVKLTLSNATNTSGLVSKLLHRATNSFIRQRLRDCTKNYADVVHHLRSSLIALKSDSYNDVNTWVSAAMTDVESCEEGLEEVPGRVSVLRDRNSVFSQLCSNALAITNLLAGV